MFPAVGVLLAQQTAAVVGMGAGGLITSAFGPLATYGVIGIGLVLLALYALAAGRSTTNPLHGAAYEEAQAHVAPLTLKPSELAAHPGEAPDVAALGFAGALLHVLNHTVFKGLLFLGAGSVIHAAGTGALDDLGGVARSMPRTAAFFSATA